MSENAVSHTGKGIKSQPVFELLGMARFLWLFVIIRAEILFFAYNTTANISVQQADIVCVSVVVCVFVDLERDILVSDIFI